MNEPDFEEFWPNTERMRKVWRYYQYSPKLTETVPVEPGHTLQDARSFAWDRLDERRLVTTFKQVADELGRSAPNQRALPASQDEAHPSRVSWHDALLGAAVADGLDPNDLIQLLPDSPEL
ncbi:hypothetical protein [Enteractinococcus helveticum]|uniref:hypothetical protein n=1 Tax=Enteractinococcus helveticum TaxID=1837282 RepID=UPI000695D96A|nr:hypothetical protein [Enteractinococcus helveticum]